MIAAEKASTANALSGPNFALSTANLYYASQPGQSLFSLTTSAPPNPHAVYMGSPEDFGQPNAPMVGKPIGRVIVFGGGLPLYERHGKIVGGLGVSDDTACADHVVAWKVRHALKLDAVPVGVAPHVTDNMILDIQDGVSVSGFGHPTCKGGTPLDQVIKALPERFPTGRIHATSHQTGGLVTRGEYWRPVHSFAAHEEAVGAMRAGEQRWAAMFPRHGRWQQLRSPWANGVPPPMRQRDQHFSSAGGEVSQPCRAL